MKSYIYYWYHHMINDEERNTITKILDNKDYTAFIEMYKKYSIKAIEYGQYYDEFECWIPMTYFPNTISVYDSEQKEIIDEISVLDKSNFNKITWHECECG